MSQAPQSNGQNEFKPNSVQNPLGSPNPSHLSSPTPQSAHGNPFGQPNMMGPPFGSGTNSPDKLMTEKIVNELQVGHFFKFVSLICVMCVIFEQKNQQTV